MAVYIYCVCSWISSIYTVFDTLEGSVSWVALFLCFTETVYTWWRILYSLLLLVNRDGGILVYFWRLEMAEFSSTSGD